MKRYMSWINNLIIEKDGIEYDFLYEMYPEIKQLYNNLWYIKNNSKKPFNKITQKRIEKINKEIKIKLKVYGIPEYILLLKSKDKYIEPVSETKLNIVNKYIKLRKVGIMVEKEYINNLNIENVNFLNEKLPLFINQIEKEKIKKK
ncbi:MAG: hypothetical protein J6K21_02950 [Bacilli bacterium]|nr:hypothetical protein [Bacilli bacterium]